MGLVRAAGTPVQNNMRELWGIMSLLDPCKYGDEHDFYDRYGGGRADPTYDQISTLQARCSA